MKVTTHAVLQVLGVIINVGTLLEGVNYIPMKYVVVIVSAVSAAQAVVGVLNHYYTPQGAKIQ